MEKIDVIILAGGEGTRLRSVVSDVPKPLALIDGKPFLDILLEQLNNFNCIGRVIMAAGYKSEMIVERYKECSKYNFKILFSIEKKLLGTGGAIKKALPLTETEDVLVLNGDSYIEVNIEDLIMTHKKNNANLTIVLKEVENADRYGSVKLDKNGRIKCFEEKKVESGSVYINAGVYLFKKELFDDVEENKVLSLEKDLFPIFIKKAVYGYISYGKFIDIGIPETYKISDEYLKEVL
ncbi:MAG: nucleotidyltransferase family protein [Nitrospirota bacterium]